MAPGRVSRCGAVEYQYSGREGFPEHVRAAANDPKIIVNGPDPGCSLPAGMKKSRLGRGMGGSGGTCGKYCFCYVAIDTIKSDAGRSGVDLSALYIIDNNLAPVMSESYGECEPFILTAGNAFYNALWQQAAAEGITVVVAAGDSGSAGCDSSFTEKRQQMD